MIIVKPLNYNDLIILSLNYLDDPKSGIVKLLAPSGEIENRLKYTYHNKSIKVSRT